MTNQKRAGRPLRYVEQRVPQPPSAGDQVRELKDTVRQMRRRIGELEEENRVLKPIPTNDPIPLIQHPLSYSLWLAQPCMWVAMP